MPKNGCVWVYFSASIWNNKCSMNECVKCGVWVENVAMSELKWWYTGPCSLRWASQQMDKREEQHAYLCVCVYCYHSEKSVHNNLLWAFLCACLFFSNFQFHTVESSGSVGRMLITFYTALICVWRWGQFCVNLFLFLFLFMFPMTTAFSSDKRTKTFQFINCLVRMRAEFSAYLRFRNSFWTKWRLFLSSFPITVHNYCYG